MRSSPVPTQSRMSGADRDRADAGHNLTLGQVTVTGPLFAPELPEATAQQGHDFLLNLRIVQQTQERLLESLVLLGLLDLAFSFGSILHGSIMPSFRQPSVPVSRP